MRCLRWMSIAAVVDTCVLMDEDHKMMVPELSTDAMKGVVNNVDDVDGTDG